jgi:hypothetical protein
MLCYGSGHGGRPYEYDMNGSGVEVVNRVGRFKKNTRMMDLRIFLQEAGTAGLAKTGGWVDAPVRVVQYDSSRGQ